MAGTLQTETGYVDVEGGKLYYEVAGEGHPLLLIHAGVAHSAQWDEQFEEFAGRYRVVRYDTRGFGKTSTESDDTSFSNRQDIADLLAHLGIHKTYVIGVSRGGQIATDFTLEHPDTVGALVLVAAGLGGFDGGEFTGAEQALANEMESLWEAKDWDWLSEMETDYWLNGPGQPSDRVPAEMRRKVRDMIHYNYSNQPNEGKPRVLEPSAAGRLSEISVPTLIIVGTLDESLMMVIADAQAAGIKGARKVVMPGTAHLPNMEQPQEFNRIVLEFLGSVAASKK